MTNNTNTDKKPLNEKASIIAFVLLIIISLIYLVYMFIRVTGATFGPEALPVFLLGIFLIAILSIPTIVLAIIGLKGKKEYFLLWLWLVLSCRFYFLYNFLNQFLV